MELRKKKKYLNGPITNSTKYSFICKGNQKIFSVIESLGLVFLKNIFVELQMDGRWLKVRKLKRGKFFIKVWQ